MYVHCITIPLNLSFKLAFMTLFALHYQGPSIYVMYVCTLTFTALHHNPSQIIPHRHLTHTQSCIHITSKQKSTCKVTDADTHSHMKPHIYIYLNMDLHAENIFIIILLIGLGSKGKILFQNTLL
jgi:hypothetical protein